MKGLIILIAVVLIVVGAVYLLLPADSLPAFLPGYEQGLARARMKHGLVAGGAGVVLLVIGWLMGRRS